MTASATFGDLLPRVASGLILAVLGAFALALGSFAFDALLLCAAGLMHWELARLSNPLSRQAPVFAGLFSAFFLLIAFGSQNAFWICAYFALHLVFQAQLLFKFKHLCLLASGAITAAVFLLHWMRLDYGFVPVFWVIFVVVLTDVGGYFGGRLIGGPKLAPKLSPKKTWSGAVTGWVLSIGVTVFFVVNGWLSGVLWLLVVAAIVVSLSSQISDIGESALKRRFGAKDSSQLIPGHGGVMDRFDGLTGAILACGLLFPLLGLQ